MKFILKLLLASFSIFLTIVLLFVALNFYIKPTYPTGLKHSKAWMFTTLSFDYKSIFRPKSWCELAPHKCKHEEDLFLPFPTITYPVDAQVDQCKKFLFVGDSFTVAPWVEQEQSYVGVFLHKYFEQYNQCAVGYRLAFGGANNSQEFYSFLNVVDQLKIDTLIWQFYWNDQVENIKEEVFYVDENNSLKHRYSWKNMLFWAGFINEKIPFVKGSHFGDSLLFLAENDDPFAFLSFDYNDLEKNTDYNIRLLDKIFEEMNLYSEKYSFDWYTVLSPLECEVVDNLGANCFQRISLQQNLRWMLKDKTNYLGLDYLDILDEAEVASTSGYSIEEDYQYLFETVKDETEVGSRHLSVEGNSFFAQQIFNNLFNLN